MRLYRWQHTKAFPSGETCTWGATCEHSCLCLKDRQQTHSAQENSLQVALEVTSHVQAGLLPKVKSEHPQRGTDGGRYRDLKTEKRESLPFDFKPVIFLRHPVLYPPSPKQTHT